MSRDSLQRLHGKAEINPSIYDEVFNRRIGQTIIAGPFFVCGEGGDDFCSLTDEEAARAMARFAEPEQISQAEVEADMGFTIITLG